MDSPVIVLERLKEAGLTVWLDGSDLKAKGKPTPAAEEAVKYLNEHKEGVIAYLRTYDPEKFTRWLEWAMSRTD